MNQQIYFTRHRTAILGFSFLFVLALMVFGFIPWLVRQVFNPDAYTYFYLVLGVAGTLLAAVLAFAFLGTKPKLALVLSAEGLMDYTLSPKGYFVPWSAMGELQFDQADQQSLICIAVEDFGVIDTSTFFYDQRQAYEARLAQYGTPLVFFPKQYNFPAEELVRLLQVALKA